MRPRLLLALATAALLALVVAPGAAADKVITEPGSDPGQTLNPGGLATHFETGRLYVADTGNDRIQVFDKDGVFVKAFGKKGSGPGQFEGPRSIAVDNSAGPDNGDVYVVDSGNERIQRFGPEGEFKLAFGSKGTGEGQFNFEVARVFVGVGPGGVVNVVDNFKAGSEFEYRLQKFDSSGVLMPPQIVLSKGPFSVQTLALNSTGELYIGFQTEDLQKYDEDGSFVEEINDPFEDASIYAIAAGENDHLFLASAGLEDAISLMELDAAGNRVRRFGYRAVQYVASSIASGPFGTGFYVGEAFRNATEGSRVLRVDFPSPGPLVFPEPCTADPIGNSKATLNARVNPEGKDTTYHFQYISEADFQANGEKFSGPGVPNPADETAESAPIGSDFTLHKASAQATGLIPETEYRCRVIATNADAPAGNPGPEGSFVTKAPLEITDTSVSAVGTGEATLNAVLNPLGISASGFFEYVSDSAFQASGFATATKAPVGEPLEFGAGEEPVLRSIQITGLDPATNYHYRLVATDILIDPKTVTSPVRSFRTFTPALGALPVDRAYELVSPARKNSGEVAIPGVASGVFNEEVAGRIQAASGSGEAVTYTSWTSFGDPEGAPNVSQYLSRRSASGWGTENISPGGFNKQPLIPPYRGFTADLGFGAFVVSEPALAPEAQEGSENLYLRDNDSGGLRALTIAEPQLVGSTGFCAGYAGASADGSRAIFAGRGALAGTGAIPGEGFSLYEWSAAEGLALVSVLPDGTPAPPVKSGLAVGEGTGFGAVGGNCTANQGPIRNAISADGSTIFWRYGGKYKESKEPLFARIGGQETIQLDAKVAGEKNGGGGTFWAATDDGSKVFFTAPGSLTAGAGAKGQLYRYDTELRTRINLTPGAVAPEIQGVIGASEDATHVYFVAEGALTGEEENEAGQKAEAGRPNLYLWHEGDGLRFITTSVSSSSWDSSPERLKARVSPDGRHLAFLSRGSQALSGYDNTRASGEGCEPDFENKLSGDPRCAQAYLYDAEADTLTCASCNPTGARPLGPTELPSWSNPYEGPRFLSEDGSKLFFETRDALSPADQNFFDSLDPLSGKVSRRSRRDVYEFERAGSGSCEVDGPGYDPASGGCLFLISSGTDDDDSYLIDASADGRDVFLSTRSVLTGWDTDERYDVYDARIGGGFPEPPPPPVPCAGEACPLPPSPAPAAPLAATPNFQGPGNVVRKPGRKTQKQKSRGQRKKHKGKGKTRKGSKAGKRRARR